MKSSTILIFMCPAFFACQKKSEPVAIEKKYQLVWADEFNGAGLPDDNLWNYEEGFIRNNEVQYYTKANLENTKVENGLLTIKATYDNFRSHPITSACLTTKGKKEFLYGRLEMKARLPEGEGAWPAFWTMGVNRYQIGWPACGEIDIMEWLGFMPAYVFGSLHKANAQNADAPLITAFAPVNPAFSKEFHVYAIEWDEKAINFFFDETNYATYTATNLPVAEWQQFTQPHFLLLNLALGGDSGGQINYSKFPFTYTIDYVRYYQKQ